MQITVRTQIGKSWYTFVIDESQEMEALQRAAVFGSPPDYCHECKGTEHFRLDSNKDKDGNIYISVLCKSCGAKAKLGRYKAGGYFWHKFEKYQKDEKGPVDVDGTPLAEIPDLDDEGDLPF